MDVGLFVDELHDSLDTGKEASETVSNVFHNFVVAGWCLGLFLEGLHHQLHELHDGQDKRTESQTSQMVSENHFVTSENWEIGLLVRTMRIVPDAASWSNNECSCGLYESIAPKCSEDESIELVETAAGVALDTGEDTATWSHKISAGDDVKKSNDADCPHRQVYYCLDDWHQNNAACVSNELTRRFADSHCQSDSAEAAQKSQKENSR